MFTVTYYKIGSVWFLDQPQYLEEGGHIEDLERVGGFHELLELAAHSSSTVVMTYDFKPFDGADEAILIGSSGEETGGYYILKTFEGHPVEIEIWVNKMIYLVRSELPEKLYLKKHL